MNTASVLLEKRNIVSRLLLNRQTNQMKRKSVVKEGLMKARQQRRMSLKSKRRLNKRHKAGRSAPSKNDDISGQFEPAHSLLLSSLKFWEVERDLIEERLATTRR
jgi:hypothetical protein